MTNKTKQYKLLTLSAILLLTSAVYGNAQIESARTSGAQFETSMDVQELINGQSQEMTLPQPEPLKVTPGLSLIGKDAFEGVQECSIVDVKFAKQPALQDAVNMLGPCMGAVSAKYGVTVSAASGLLSKPGWRGGVPGIKILVSGKLPAENTVIVDLNVAVQDNRDGMLLTYPAQVEYLGNIEPLHKPKGSSLQEVVDSCNLAATVGHIKTSKDFVKYYGKCLKSASGFGITAVKPAPPLDEQLLGPHIWVFSTAKPDIIKGMNGKIILQQTEEPVSIMVKAYFDARIEPCGPPQIE